MTDINFLAPINDRSYGLVATNLVYNLDKLGANTSLFLINPQGAGCEPQYVESVKRAVGRASFFNPDAPCVRLWHQFDMGQFVGRGPRIGFPIFELNKFKDVEKHQLKWLDKVLVCSKWAADIVESELPNLKGKIGIVPLAADPDIFRPRQPPQHSTYRIFNAGKCEIRKGHDILPTILDAAFDGTEDVEFHLSFNNPFLPAEEFQSWVNFYLGTNLGRAGKVKFWPWHKTQADLAASMAAMDCAIFPSRAEGWNLELCEAISMGIPCIATNYSAHTEFCNSENCFLVDVDSLESAYDGKWFFGDGEWAHLGDKQIKEFVEKLRYCYENRINTNLGGLQQTWLNSSKIFLDESKSTLNLK